MASESWGQLLYVDSNNQAQGIFADFVRSMNKIQNKYYFELAIYPRLRLDRMFIEKEADVYLLRTVLWTRPELGLLPTKTILASGDVYFGKRNNQLGPRLFTNLASRRIVGVRGYHYGVFDNNPDEDFIKKNFNAHFVSSNETVLKFILADRADIGIVPEIIFAMYLQIPELRDQLIVAKEYDSRVNLSNLVRKDGPISVSEMDEIANLLIMSGDVARLKEKLNLPLKIIKNR